MIYDLRYIIYNFIILFILLIVNNSSNAQGLQESDSLLIDQNINLKDSSIINDTIATTTNQSFSKYKKKFTAIDTVVKSDSTITTKKIKKQKKIDTTHYSPKVAAWRGAIFPGLGQIYMKKYWKLPIVYGAIGTVLYFLIDKYLLNHWCILHFFEVDRQNKLVLFVVAQFDQKVVHRCLSS